MSEAAFQRQVTGLAQLLGWHWAHFRPGRTERGWATPVSGPIGAGFPDLVLANVLRQSGAEVRVWRPSDIDAIAEELR